MSNLLKTRNIYRPILYPKALEYRKKQRQMDWLVDELSFNGDVQDWEHKLTDQERGLISKLFRFFVQGDILVADAYLDRYIPVLGKQPEVKMMMSVFAASETEHIVAYAKLLDTIGMPDEEFSKFREHEEMTAKVDYLMQFNPQDFINQLSMGEDARNEALKVLAKTLAVYSGFMEGLQLFSSFAVLLNFSRLDPDNPEKEGLMLDMGKVIEWSIRDELLHCEGMTWLFREFIKENPQIWTDEFRGEIYQACRDMVALEDAFIDLMFEGMDEVQGLKPETLKQYIRFVADRRLADLTLKANYGITENPLPWMDWMLADSHGNFFENRVTEYAKGHDTDYF